MQGVGCRVAHRCTLFIKHECMMPVQPYILPTYASMLQAASCMNTELMMFVQPYILPAYY